MLQKISFIFTILLLMFTLQQYIPAQEVSQVNNNAEIDELLREAGFYSSRSCYEEALKLYEKVLTLDHNNCDGWVCKGYNLAILGKYKDVLTCFDTALKCNPDDTEYNNISSIYFLKGEYYRSLNKFDEAIECYKKSLIHPASSDSSHFSCNMKLSEAYVAKGDCNNALQCCDDIPEPENNKGDLLAIQGFIYSEMGEFDKSKEYFCKAISTSGYMSYYVIYYKGKALYNQGKYKEAMEIYDRIIEEDEEYIDAWYYKGEILYKENKYEEARNCFKKVLEFDVFYNIPEEIIDKLELSALTHAIEKAPK